MSEIIQIKLCDIIPNKNQPRLDFDDSSIAGLAESIKENGLLQPITVRKNGEKYELIAGERRYRAHLLNEAETIPAILLEMDDDESANLALIENLQREDLNAVEQALAIQRIMRIEDLTQEELAKRLGYRQSTIANKLRLLRLPEYIKKAIVHGEITERHARALLKVDPDRLEEVFKVIVKREYNVSRTEEYIRSLNEKKKGVSNNVKVGLNTLEQAYKMCRDAGIDGDYHVTEYEDEIKVTIRFRK